MNVVQRIRRYLGFAHKDVTRGETSSNRSARFQARQLPLLLLHAAQLVVAIILMGLSAYTAHYVAYNVLVACLVFEICTILVVTYLIVCRFRYPKLCSHYASSFLQALMLAFSIIALGLLASLTQLWQQPECTYNYTSGYQCSSYEKRGLRTMREKDTTSYNTYSGALIAGSVLFSLEIVLWAVTTGTAFIDKWTDQRDAAAAAPRPPGVEQAIPPALQRHPLADSWDSSHHVPTAHRSGPQPLLPDDDDDHVNENPHLLAPPPLRFAVTNQDHTPQSTPGFEVPPYICTPRDENPVYETVANVHAPAAPPVLPHIIVTPTLRRYEAFNPYAAPRRKTVARSLGHALE